MPLYRPRSPQRAFTYAVERDFNSISVDGDMSTNDTILLIAIDATFVDRADSEMAKVGPSSKGRVHRVSAAFVPSDGTPTLPVLVNGELEKVDEGRASEILKLEDFEILAADFGGGDKAETAKYYTCDFSYVGSKPFKVKCVCSSLYGDYRS
uniref:Putative hypothetical arginine biosynthesis bifunctional protein ARG7 n=1 Tax=Moniliophthora roreri TaxID=221103 RepID=A0A0W0EU89_MONRR